MTTTQFFISLAANLPGLVCFALWTRGVATDNQLYGWALLPFAPLGAIGWLSALGLSAYATWQYARRERPEPDAKRSFAALLCGWLLLLPFAWTLAQYMVLLAFA